MRVFAFAIGDRARASSRLRVWDHVMFLKTLAETVHADSLAPSSLAGRRGALLARLILRCPLWTWHFMRADVVYIQETLLLWPLVMLAKRLGRKTVIFDFSDPVDTIGRGVKRRVRQIAFNQMVRAATHVIVENRRYQSILPRDNTRQFYGPVDVTRYQGGRSQAPVKASGAPLRIGWTGSPGTLHFIAPLFAVLDDLAADLPLELTLIGVTKLDHRFTNLPVTCLPWDEFGEFLQVPQFDLGLHKLDSSPDALKRGAGKLFIYMAAGVPFITDACGIGCDVAEESGVGTTVSAAQDWAASLRAIISDDEARTTHAAEGLVFARSNMSYEAFRVLLRQLILPGKGTGRRI